jgi:hypothetical protein
LGIGVHVSIHLLSPTYPVISQANQVFIGVFNPGVSPIPTNYIISGSFPLSTQVAFPGKDHQLAIVVDPPAICA